MKQQVVSFRITRVAKKTVAVAICGLFSASSGVALGQNVSPDGAVPTKIFGDSTPFDIFFSDGDAISDIFGADTNKTITLTLDSNANIVGSTPTGASGTFAVFTRDVRSNASSTETGNYSIDSVSFSDPNVTSSLILKGGNTITGMVGVKAVRVSNATASDSYTGVRVVDALDLININGTGIDFGSEVFAKRIEITVPSATVVFKGNVGDAQNLTIFDTKGNTASITLGNSVTFSGSIDNSVNTTAPKTLTLQGNANLTGSLGNATSGFNLVDVQGNGANVFLGSNSSIHDIRTAHLNFSAPATVVVQADLIMNQISSVTSVLGVTFNRHADAKLEISGDIVGRENELVVSSAQNNTGTVTFFGTSQSQSVTGDLGAIGGNSLKRINVGSESENGLTNVTVTGDIHASDIVFNQNASAGSSMLTIGSGHSIVATINTSVALRGILEMAGGIQSVTGQIGNTGSELANVRSGANSSVTTFTGDIFSVNVTNTGNGTSIYQSNVTATNINVDAGISNFSGRLQAISTYISSGEANLINEAGTSAQTANTDIIFTGNGTANLYNDLTGEISFANQINATVNLWDTKNIEGNITAANGNGILNVLGGGAINGAIGSTGNSIKEFNIGTIDPTKTVNANGSIFSQTVNFVNNGTLLLADNVNVTGNIVTASNMTGTLTALGSSIFEGNVGSENSKLLKINAGVLNENVVFNNGTVYAETLQFSQNGIVIFNGLNPQNSSAAGGVFQNQTDLGFVGTVDFNYTTGQMQIGDNVDLIAQGDTSNQTLFINAGNASLSFLGSSVVTGTLGSATPSNDQNIKTIFAGVNGSTVTFLNNVYLSGNTLNVTGDGVVNLLGDLNSPIAFAANGSVNVADGKIITGPVTTATNGTGSLNFVGSTVTQDDIGTNALRLFAVNFHSFSSDTIGALVLDPSLPATASIGHNIFALDTTVGANTTATITGNVNLGTNVTLAGDTVILYTAGNTSVTPSRFQNGTILWAAPTRSTISDNGTITTNNATMHFAIGAEPWNATAGGGEITVNGSSSISGGANTSLVLSGGETINLSLLGSLRNGQAHTLINVAGNVSSGDTNVSMLVNDNSFVINSTLSRADNGSGDLLVTFTRDPNAYMNLSQTTGHFSNPAAVQLGTLAAGGVNYTADMQTALNMLDIDQWGFGNNVTNLARQAIRLAPIANNSNGFAAFKTASAVTDSLGLRMHEMRIPEDGTLPASVWLKTAVQSGQHEQINDYDGFDTDINLVTLGADNRFSENSLVGIAGSYSTSKVTQRNSREGEDSSINAFHLSLFGAIDFTENFFLDGTLTGSWLKTSGNRATITGRTAQYDIDGNQVTGKVSVGYRIPVFGFNATLTPILSHESSSLKQADYRETGSAGDVGLIVNSQSLTRNQTAFGLRFRSTHQLGGIVVKPDLAVFGTRDSGRFALPVVARFIGDQSANPSFTTQVADQSQYELSGSRATLGLGVLMSRHSSINVRYEHQKSGQYKSNSFDLLVRWDFD